MSLFLVVSSLFTSFTETDPDMSATTPLELGTPGFVNAVEGITRSTRLPVDSEILIFNDGREFLADLVAEIGAARRSVTITNYIFEEGVMTGAILDALIAAAGRGVEVRLLRDGNGAKNAPAEKLDALVAAGGRVVTFRPLSFRSILRFHKRTHVRAIVVDGVVGYTGGLAFDDDWLGQGAEPTQWRDLMFKYGGALARATQDQFSALWRQTYGEILTGADFYPIVEVSPEPRDSVAEGNAAAVVAPADSSWFVSLFHSPVPDLAGDLNDLIWLSITAARDHIYIATPYMVPDDDILHALMDAVRRGVRVEVLMPGPHTDAKPIQAATRARYDELLEAGLLIFEYQPGRFHAKAITVDGRWSMIGSANMDNRSAALNIENVLAIEDRALAAGLEAEFGLGKAQALPVTLESWDPSLLDRAWFNAARIFAKQY